MIKTTNLNKLTLLAVTAIVLLNACKKDRLPAIPPQPSSTKGVYVLCEGPFGQSNNSKISYYDIASATVDIDFFKTKNGIDLGTDASDLRQYGSKMYCVVTGAKDVAQDSYIEVINVSTGRSIKRIPFYDATKDFSPRRIAFYKSKAYVTGYDGYVSKIDTATLNIESRILVGGALEGITIVNNKLFAANSDHVFYKNANNSSVSVVDLNTFTKVTDIQVSFNPTKLAATENGDVYVVTSGSYQPFIASAFEKLSSLTNTKTQTSADNLWTLAITNNKGFVVTNDYPAKLKVFNISTGVVGDEFITDGTLVSTVYGVTVNSLDNNVFVADANNYSSEAGKFFCFDGNGKKKFEFATAAIPQFAVFNYTYK